MWYLLWRFRIASAFIALFIFGVMLCMHVIAAEKPGKLRIKTKRDDDKVELKIENDAAAVTVHSPFGISAATIERTDGAWPATIEIRLHLRGLEHFEVSAGAVKLAGEYSATPQDGKPVRCWKVGDEKSPLKSTDPSFLDIRSIDGAGRQSRSLPTADGYFRIVLPRPLLASDVKTITVSWIDFYRN